MTPRHPSAHDPDRHSAIIAATRLLAEWRPVDPYSGTQHHMVFDRQILADLMRRVEDRHQRPFWEAFLTTTEHTKWTGASEYVLYRHFAAKFFADRTGDDGLDAAPDDRHPQLVLRPCGQYDAEELHEIFGDPQMHTIGDGLMTARIAKDRWSIRPRHRHNRVRTRGPTGR